jgi:hypothetical protein
MIKFNLSQGLFDNQTSNKENNSFTINSLNSLSLSLPVQSDENSQIISDKNEEEITPIVQNNLLQQANCENKKSLNFLQPLNKNEKIREILQNFKKPSIVSSSQITLVPEKKIKKQPGRKKKVKNIYGLESTEIENFLNRKTVSRSEINFLNKQDRLNLFFNLNENSLIQYKKENENLISLNKDSLDLGNNYRSKLTNSVGNNYNHHIIFRNKDKFSNSEISISYAQGNNFSLSSSSYLKIIFNSSILKLSVKIHEGKLKFLNEITIQRFLPIAENLKLLKFIQKNEIIPFYNNSNSRFIKSDSLVNHYETSNLPSLDSSLICSFSICSFNTCTEQVFNLLSNLKVEENYAVLSNKLKEKHSLILIDNNKFYSEINTYSNIFKHEHHAEYSILSVRDEIISDRLKISKPFDVAILVDKRISPKKHPSSQHLALISTPPKEVKEMKSLFLDLYKQNDKDNERIINLTYENRKFFLKLKEMETEYRNLEIEKNDLSEKLERISADFNLLCTEVKEKTALLSHKESEQKIALERIKYLQEKYNCTVDYFDGFIIESENKRTTKYQEDDIVLKPNTIDNKSCTSSYSDKQLREELLLCISCYEKNRETVFLNCGHSAYCIECCLKVDRLHSGKPENKFTTTQFTKKNKSENFSSNINLSSCSYSKSKKNKNLTNKCHIDCPLCRTVNKNYMIVYFN